MPAGAAAPARGCRDPQPRRAGPGEQEGATGAGSGRALGGLRRGSWPSLPSPMPQFPQAEPPPSPLPGGARGQDGLCHARSQRVLAGLLTGLAAHVLGGQRDPRGPQHAVSSRGWAHPGAVPAGDPHSGTRLGGSSTAARPPQHPPSPRRQLLGHSPAALRPLSTTGGPWGHKPGEQKAERGRQAALSHPSPPSTPFSRGSRPRPPQPGRPCKPAWR